MKIIKIPSAESCEVAIVHKKADHTVVDLDEGVKLPLSSTATPARLGGSSWHLSPWRGVYASCFKVHGDPDKKMRFLLNIGVCTFIIRTAKPFA